MRQILIPRLGILIIKRLNFDPLYTLAMKHNTLNYRTSYLTIRISFPSNSKILKIDRSKEHARDRGERMGRGII